MIDLKKMLIVLMILNNIIYATRIGVISKEYIQQFLPTNPHILEAGAHIGIDTLEMATLWPEAIIYAFEPEPNLFKQLKLNSAGNKNINCFQLALSNQTGSSIFYVSSGASDGSSSLLEPLSHLNDHPDVQFKRKINVNTTTLQDWVKQNDIAKIDFMWLDMQGFELDMLKKAGDILKTVKVIYTEVSLKETYKGAPLYDEIKNWLNKKGFIVVKEQLPWQDMGNVLFVRK